MRRREFVAVGETRRGKKMNPIEWKREHQIALGAAILVGFALGLAFGYTRDRHFGGFWDWFTTALNPN
jgi:hypothetical protein